jgi:hypothetical protein
MAVHSVGHPMGGPNCLSAQLGLPCRQQTLDQQRERLEKPEKLEPALLSGQPAWPLLLGQEAEVWLGL